MKKNMIVLVVAFFMGLGSILSAHAKSAQPGTQGLCAASLSLRASLQQNHPVALWMLNRLADKLQLTQTQREQIDDIIASELPVMKPIVQQLIDNRQQWRSANQGMIFDEDQARSFAEQQSALMTELIVVKERMRVEMRSVLTSEQREQVDELCSTLEERVSNWLTSFNS